MTDTDLPPLHSPLTHLRVPFCFVPQGKTLPTDWAAAHPGFVKFPATLRMKPDSALPPELRPLPLDHDWPSPAVMATRHGAMGAGAGPDGLLSVAPRIVSRPKPPPRLPAHRAPAPFAYTGPQARLAAFGGTTASAAGREALIRTAQAVLDKLASQEAARAATVALDSLAELAPPLAAGAILLRPEPAGAGEEQTLRRALAELRAKGRRSFDMPPPSPPLPGLVPPTLPRRKPGEGGFTPSPPAQPNPGFTPAPPPVLVRPGRPTTENRPIILDSRKDEPSYSGETELSRILVPEGKRIGWVEKGADRDIRTVTGDKFTELKAELLKNATRFFYESYSGNVYQLPNGDLIGIRMSKRFGETIDVLRSETSLVEHGFKVHKK